MTAKTKIQVKWFLAPKKKKSAGEVSMVAVTRTVFIGSNPSPQLYPPPFIYKGGKKAVSKVSRVIAPREENVGEK